MRFIGLDLHKRVIEVCILDSKGKVISRHSVACERKTLKNFAKKHLLKTNRLVVEAITNTWAVAELLRPLVGSVTVGNPLQIRAIAHAKVKTDKIDSEVLANLLRCEFLPDVWEPEQNTQKLRHLTGVRSALIGDRSRFKNRIQSILASHLVILPECGLFTKNGLIWLRSLELPGEAKGTVERYLRLYESVEAEIESVDLELRGLAHNDQRVRLLMTLPGVAHGVALTLIAAIGDVNRFRNGDHAASYLGLTPIVRQSAGNCYRGPITKAGCSTTRAMTIQAAQHAADHQGPLGAFFRRLKKKKSRNVAIVATARKLVTIAYLMLKNNEPYRYGQPDSIRAKLRIVERALEEEGEAPKEPCERKGTGEPKNRLNRIYHRFGLPQAKNPSEWSAGEKRSLEESGTKAFAHQVHSVPPRPGRKPKAVKT